MKDLEKLFNMYKKPIFVLLFIFVLFMVPSINPEIEEDSKKEGFAFSLSAAGIVLIVFGGILAYTGIGFVPGAIMIAVGVFISFTGIQGIFRPTPTIPSWAYFVGFLVLILTALKKKK